MGVMLATTPTSAERRAWVMNAAMTDSGLERLAYAEGTGAFVQRPVFLTPAIAALLYRATVIAVLDIGEPSPTFRSLRHHADVVCFDCTNEKRGEQCRRVTALEAMSLTRCTAR